MKRLRDEQSEKIDHLTKEQEPKGNILDQFGFNGPIYVQAPMVDNSDLAFRLLCRRYGVQLSYTEMLYSKTFAESRKYRSNTLRKQLHESDHPLVLQFAGNDPKILLDAALHAQGLVEAIDVNFGCPQNCAKSGGYGSFLLEDKELVFEIVRTLSQGLTVPVFCKIRILPSLEDTLEIARGIEANGCKLLAVHARTKEQKGRSCGAPDWDVVREIKKALTIPVILNGGIREFDDIQLGLDHTGCDGIMSAEKIMDNPALFSNTDPDRFDLFLEYLELATEYPPPGRKHINAHFFSMLGRKELLKPEYEKLKIKYLQTKNIVDLPPIIAEMKMERDRLANEQMNQTNENE